MTFTDALRGEHGVFYAWFAQIEGLVANGAAADVLRAQARALAGALVAHAEMENDHLFTALAAKIGPLGPIEVMRHEHQEIESGIGRAADEEDAAKVGEALTASIALARVHFSKEEQVLFPMAEQQLDREALVELAGKWATLRGVTLR